jgi:hypothetical protein
MLPEKQKSDETAMVSLNGAPGDHLLALPALRQFSKKWNHCLLTAHWRGGLVKAVYENMRIFDKIVWLDPSQMTDWHPNQVREYLLQQSQGYTIDWHYPLDQTPKGMMASADQWTQIPVESIRNYHKDVTFYDRYCDFLKVPAAKGLRPKMKFSKKEQSWLKKFAGTIRESRIVGWQWSGSAKVKEFPRSEEVIQNLLTQYKDIHIFMMGSRRFEDRKIKHRRCTNLAGKIKWRQAVLFTSAMDLYIAPDTSVMVAAQGFPNVSKILLATTTSGREIAFPETQIIQSTAGCSPCYRVLDTCDMDDCCGKIDDQEIYTAADHILRSE